MYMYEYASICSRPAKSAQATRTMAPLVVPLLLLWHVPSVPSVPKVIDASAVAGVSIPPHHRSGRGAHLRASLPPAAKWSCIDGECQKWAKGLFESRMQCEDQSPECRSATVGNSIGQKKHSGVLGWLFHSAQDKREQARAVAAKRARLVHQQEAMLRREKQAERAAKRAKAASARLKEQLQNERLRRQKRRQKRKRERESERRHERMADPFASFGAFGSFGPEGPFGARGSFGDESAPGAHLGEDDGHKDDDGGDDSTDDGGNGHGDGDGNSDGRSRGHHQHAATRDAAAAPPVKLGQITLDGTGNDSSNNDNGDSDGYGSQGKAQGGGALVIPNGAGGSQISGNPAMHEKCRDTPAPGQRPGCRQRCCVEAVRKCNRRRRLQEQQLHQYQQPWRRRLSSLGQQRRLRRLAASFGPPPFEGNLHGEERAMDRQMDREEHEMDQIDNMMDMGFPRFPFPPFGPGGPPQYGAGASKSAIFSGSNGGGGDSCFSSEAEDCHNLRCGPKGRK